MPEGLFTIYRYFDGVRSTLTDYGHQVVVSLVQKLASGQYIERTNPVPQIVNQDSIDISFWRK